MTVRQITVRISPSTKAAFERYAANLNIDSSGLTNLLIYRELTLRRLVKQKNVCQLLKTRRKPRGDPPFQQITAHVPKINLVHEFDKYAQECGLSRDKTGAWIIETELTEKWLEHAILKF